MALHQNQNMAVCHGKGPMLVLAGPGSGKTTVITHRIKYLIEREGVAPGHILVITFTRAAASEMKLRFQTLIEGRHVPVSFGTFHSIFFQILKHAYRYDASNIVREEQRIEYVRELIQQNRIETEDENELVSAVLAEISIVKGDMLNLDYYYSKNCSEEVFKSLYRGYEQALIRRNLIDFDDMLVMCYELFRQRPDILNAWQQKYEYILVDEFQDINRIQYEIIRMLAAPQNHLFIVGDDDQSIYRFRGAKPEIMHGFMKDYPDAKKVLLPINYRCPETIVRAAGRVIARNKTRYEKDIRSANPGGKPVLTVLWPDAPAETAGIVREILEYQKLGYSLSDIAVLYRTNLNPRLLIEKLMEYNIPFYSRDRLPNLYEHWIAGNIRAYLNAACGDYSRSNFLQLINRPNRYISRDSLEGQVISLEAVKSFYQDRGWMVERIEQLEYDLRMLAGMAPLAAINYIRKAVGYDEYIREYAEYRRMKPEELTEVLDQLQESAAGYKTRSDWYAHMEAYAEELKQQGKEQNKPTEGVNLMTMHSAKGLEYPIVYILDANDTVMPHHKAVLDHDIEEERRMFYVAMTRAKERLHVYAVADRYGKKQELSRFVNEYLDAQHRLRIVRGKEEHKR